MKKLIAFTLAAIMALSMAACSKSIEDETAKPTDKPADKPSTNESKPVQKPSESKPGNDESKPGTENTQPSKPEDNKDEEAFAEIVLVDDENVTVKVVGTEESSLLGYSLKVFIENKTDKELMFTADNVSVNGFMCDPFWAESVDGGKKSNDTMTFLKSDFEKNEITTVEQIKLTLRVYDKNDLTAKDLVNVSVTLDF